MTLENFTEFIHMSNAYDVIIKRTQDCATLRDARAAIYSLRDDLEDALYSGRDLDVFEKADLANCNVALFMSDPNRIAP